MYDDPGCRKAFAVNIKNYLDVCWHWGQVIPLEHRTQLAKLIGEYLIATDKDRVASEIVDLLDRNNVKIIISSKHKQITFQSSSGD